MSKAEYINDSSEVNKYGWNSATSEPLLTGLLLLVDLSKQRTSGAVWRRNAEVDVLALGLCVHWIQVQIALFVVFHRNSSGVRTF